MKNATLLLVLCAINSVVYAQIPAKKPDSVVNRNMGLEVSAGYSMALGIYASDDKQNKKSGHATGGWQVQVTFDWMGKKDFGMAIQYTFQKNTLSDSTMFIIPDGWKNGTLGPGSWTNHFLMVGPVFMKSIKKIHVDAKIMGGVIVSASPNFTTPNPYDTTGNTKDINLGTGFAYQISAGIGYKISSHIAFKFNLNLLGGWPMKNKQYGAKFIGYYTYKDPETGLEYSEPVYSATITYEFKKVVTTLNPSIGLVYRF